MQRKELFGKKIIFVYVALIIFMFGAVLRIFSINTNEKILTSAANNRYRIKLSNMRYTVFDKNMRPITNAQERIMAVVYPVPRAVTAVSSLLSKEDFADLQKRLSGGKPVAVELPKEIECDGVYCYKIRSCVSKDMICPQLIGYTDSDSHGVMGIQKAYENLLYHEPVSALVSTDSSGKPLLGADTQLSCDTGDYNSGIMLTLDSSLQSVAETAMQEVKSGTAIVSEVGTGKIRALVSKPEFDVTDISEHLEDEDSPFLNRALTPYNVGSVFKPVVAAALIEQGKYTDFSYYCSGSTDISGHTFGCHKYAGHGIMDLKNAITNSCNVFFYNVAQKIGSKAILETASAFRLGKAADIGGIYTASGSIPKASENLSATDIANLSIGQGKLLLPPISLLTVYEAIANKGVYHEPTVIEGEVKNGVLYPAKEYAQTKALKEETADTLKEYLKNVVENGTGKAAKPSETTAAGKTATAQTGWKKNGAIIQNSWFCGFFPADEPKYVVVVMIDDTAKNGILGAPIFKNIADGIYLFEKTKKVQ